MDLVNKAVWIDLTGDGRQSILCARATTTNKSGTTTGELVWLERPLPHSYDANTGDPLEEDGTDFDPFSPRHAPWKLRVLDEGPDVIFSVADLDPIDDTIEIIASQYYGKKISVHSLKIGPTPQIVYKRIIDDSCGSVFSSVLADLDGIGSMDTSFVSPNTPVVIACGGDHDTESSLDEGDVFSHLLVTGHDDAEDEIKAVGGGGSLFTYRVPTSSKGAWKNEPWPRVAVPIKMQCQLQNMIVKPVVSPPKESSPKEYNNMIEKEHFKDGMDMNVLVTKDMALKEQSAVEQELQRQLNELQQTLQDKEEETKRREKEWERRLDDKEIEIIDMLRQVQEKDDTISNMLEEKEHTKIEHEKALQTLQDMLEQQSKTGYTSAYKRTKTLQAQVDEQARTISTLTSNHTSQVIELEATIQKCKSDTTLVETKYQQTLDMWTKQLERNDVLQQHIDELTRKQRDLAHQSSRSSPNEIELLQTKLQEWNDRVNATEKRYQESQRIILCLQCAQSELKAEKAILQKEMAIAKSDLKEASFLHIKERGELIDEVYGLNEQLDRVDRMVNNLQDQYSALQSEHFALISTLEESQRTKMVNFVKKRLLVPNIKSRRRRPTIKTGKYWSDLPPQFGSGNERRGSNNGVRDSITCPESPDSSPYVALADCSWVDFEDRFPDDDGF